MEQILSWFGEKLGKQKANQPRRDWPLVERNEVWDFVDTIEKNSTSESVDTIAAVDEYMTDLVARRCEQAALRQQASRSEVLDPQVAKMGKEIRAWRIQNGITRRELSGLTDIPLDRLLLIEMGLGERSDFTRTQLLRFRVLFDASDAQERWDAVEAALSSRLTAKQKNAKSIKSSHSSDNPRSKLSQASLGRTKG